MNRPFSSGRTKLVGFGRTFPVPIPLDPAAHAGAVAVGLDPADSKRKLYFSDGTEWTRSIFDTMVSEQIERLISDILLSGFDEADLPDPTLLENLRRYAFNNTRGLPGFVWNDKWNYLADEARVAEIAKEVSADAVRIAPGNVEYTIHPTDPDADFSSLQDALTYLAGFIPAIVDNGGPGSALQDVRATVRILAGAVLVEQVHIQNSNFGWVRIISDDAQVTVDEAALTKSDNDYDTVERFPFINVRNGVCPLIETKFVAAPDGENRTTIGLRLVNAQMRGRNADADDFLPIGFDGFDTNVNVHAGGVFLSAGNASIVNARTNNVIVEQGGYFSALGSDLTGAGTGNSVLSRLGGIAVLQGCDARKAGSSESANDLRVQNGGIIILRSEADETIHGGLSQPPSRVTVDGVIFDQRNPNLAPELADVLFRSSGNLGLGGLPSVLWHVINQAATTGYAQPHSVRQINGPGTYTEMLTGQLSSNVMFLEVIDQANTKGELRLQPYGGVVSVNGAFIPVPDNALSLGRPANRFDTAYLGSAPVVTSDEHEKKWRGPLTEAELRVAKRLIDEFGIYQFLDSIAEKGEAARLHYGVRAQRVMALFEHEGLDWRRYAWCCHDKWDAVAAQPAVEEVRDEKGEIVVHGRPAVPGKEAGERYGIREQQFAYWVIAAIAAVQKDHEQRLAALEARL